MKFKFNLLAGMTLLLICNSVAVEAETTDNSGCELTNNCTNILKITQLAPLTNLEKSDRVAPEGKALTVATLTSVPQGNAAMLNGSVKLISQTTPTDSSANPFRATRSVPSYIGIGANLGITGNSGLGGRSVAIISKLGLNETTSVRPSILLSDFVSFLIPVTYDLAPQQLFDNFQFSPYLGGGVAITTGNGSSFGLLLTAGIDAPISPSFSVNVAANLGFLRTTDLGILVGVGYNF